MPNLALVVTLEYLITFLVIYFGTTCMHSLCMTFLQVNNVESHRSTEHHELSNMNMTSTNPFLSPTKQQAEDSFNQGYQSGDIKDQRPSMSSVDFSEGSDFAEGKSDVKINEYQAAWNVTNAIQV